MEDSELGRGLTCFIVSPIGSKLEPAGTQGRARYEESIVMWEEVIEPACATFGLAPIRSDRISATGEIPDQIFTYLRDADVVVADLSHANPNVMYELGLRHSKPGITIQIGEYGFLPFDVATIRTNQFNRTAAGLIGARNELIEALRTALNGGGSPLRATTIFTENTSPTAEAVNQDVAKSVAPDPSAPVAEEPAILELLAEGETATRHIGEVLSQSTVELHAVGEIVASTTKRVTASDAAGKGFAGRLLAAKTLADELTAPADRLENYANEFLRDVTAMNAMIEYMLVRIANDEEDQGSAEGFFTSVIGLIDAAETSAVGITTFRNESRNMRKTSKALDAASKTLERAGSRFLEGIAIMSTWRGSINELTALQPV